MSVHFRMIINYNRVMRKDHISTSFFIVMRKLFAMWLTKYLQLLFGDNISIVNYIELSRKKKNLKVWILTLLLEPAEVE